MSPLSSASTRYTTASGISFAPACSAFSAWITPLYIAAIGQIGMQLLLPQQVGRASYGRLLRATGSGTTLNPFALSTTEKRWSMYDSGKAVIGYGFARGEPRSTDASGPDTPSWTSAA